MGRFATACSAFWNILTSPEAEARWRRLPETTEAPTETPPKPAEAPATTAAGAEAIHTLALLQREGRLVDFLQESIESYSDAQIGAAVRQIHAGCRRVLQEIFAVEPVCAKAEGETVKLGPDFDPRAMRLTGHADAAVAASGIVRHRGWRCARLALPRRSSHLDATIICQAEIEV